MNARDELQKVIFQSMRLNTQIDLKEDRRLKGSQLAWAGYAANSVLNAGYQTQASLAEEGYRTRRTITTAEELDGLPVGSVILDRDGMSLHKTPWALKGSGWNASNGTRDVGWEEIAAGCFPATVLHEGDAA